MEEYNKVQEPEMMVDTHENNENETPFFVIPRIQEGEHLHLTFQRLVRMVFHVLRQFDDPYYQGFAAQIAYYFFMSIIPILVVLSQVVGLFDISLDFIIEWITESLGDNISAGIIGLFQAESVGVTNFAMLFVALWAASGLEFSLSRLASRTISDGRYRFNFFKERILSIPLSLFSILTIAVSLVVYVYGDIILTAAFGKYAQVLKILSFFKGPTMTILFFIMIMYNYTRLPRIKIPKAAMLPGACVATVGIMLVTKGYSTYVAYVSNYDILYGSFASFVAVLLWFFLIAWVLCIGMMFNKSWDLYMARGRLSPRVIRVYLREMRGITDENFESFYIYKPNKIDRTQNTVAQYLSKKFVPGYAYAREACDDIYDNAPDRERDS